MMRILMHKLVGYFFTILLPHTGIKNLKPPKIENHKKKHNNSMMIKKVPSLFFLFLMQCLIFFYYFYFLKVILCLVFHHPHSHKTLPFLHPPQVQPWLHAHEDPADPLWPLHTRTIFKALCQYS